MSWQVSRMQQLTTNIANAETPHYVRRDLKDFGSVLKNHSHELRKNQSIFSPILSVRAQDHRIVPEEISRETEVLSMTENTVDHLTNLNYYKKCQSMLKTVIGKSQNT